jgi:hypothetical protein
VRQLVRDLLPGLRIGAPGKGQEQILPGRADLDPALIVAANLETEPIDPELLGPLAWVTALKAPGFAARLDGRLPAVR